MKTVLVTGGTGFIGSHTCIELINAGYDVVVVDNLCNSKELVLDRVKAITGTRPRFYNVDILDKEKLNQVFGKENIDCVIHFAGLKAVGESVYKPIEYYENNFSGTLVLLDVMRNHGVKNIVFSSSATVYGVPAFIPITEECPLGNPTNPYGQTKNMLEQVLTDVHRADPEWNVTLLRYFNPVGGHPSGTMGEDPTGVPNNLTPYITRVALGLYPFVHVYGNDYDTKDGTGVRDYIHVMDLASGHVAALKATNEKPGVHIWNLGTGVGYSVLDVIAAFEKVVGHPIEYKIEPRRAGDVAACYASADKAKEELGWQAKYTLKDMCEDAWRWQQKNPEGYC